MNAEQLAKLRRLAGCTFLPGSWDKRFVRDMSGRSVGSPLSAAQAETIERLWWRYRKQLGHSDPKPRPISERPSSNPGDDKYGPA